MLSVTSRKKIKGKVIPDGFKVRHSPVASDVSPRSISLRVVHSVSHHLTEIFPDINLKPRSDWARFECDIVGIIEHRRQIAKDSWKALIHTHVGAVPGGVERN